MKGKKELGGSSESECGRVTGRKMKDRDWHRVTKEKPNREK